jgi:putative ABC transport system ATP-binding protein
VDKVAVSIKGLVKTYPPDTRAISGLDLDIYQGDWTVLMGASGSGKTTLLNMISCMERPTSGTIEVLGKDLTSMSDRELTVFRRNNIGIVFQQYNLIPYLTALENVEIAQFFHSVVDKGSAQNVLTEVGLADRLGHTPTKLSGGEQQRVSIARAVINEPSIILADEPTGNLDRSNGKKVMEVLAKLHRKGQTILFVTHDTELARWGDRVITLSDGRVIADDRKVN